jgi:hypothetical protein
MSTECAAFYVTEQKLALLLGSRVQLKKIDPILEKNTQAVGG